MSPHIIKSYNQYNSPNNSIFSIGIRYIFSTHNNIKKLKYEVLYVLRLRFLKPLIKGIDDVFCIKTYYLLGKMHTSQAII